LNLRWIDLRAAAGEQMHMDLSFFSHIVRSDFLNNKPSKKVQLLNHLAEKNARCVQSQVAVS
jgi:hypothetical protein